MSIGYLLSIGAGGALGAISRYSVSATSAQVWGAQFPYGTLIVNVLGSFVMGVLVALFAHYWSPPAEIKAFLIVGFLGAFTTFSAFSLDSITLLERGDYFNAALYISASVLLSIAALFTGLFIIRQIVL